VTRGAIFLQKKMDCPAKPGNDEHSQLRIPARAVSRQVMRTYERANAPGATLSFSHGLVLPLFVAAIFASATLLFVVQPMFAKMVLPQLGGAASVWSTAIVFFESVLLVGYVYAHVLVRFAHNRAGVLVHVAVMIGACAVLPLQVPSSWGSPPASGETLWLLTLFMASVGLPFFALSANGSLLQAWFARTDHPAAKDPYFLYVASNAGSFLALVSYPVVVEPFVGLHDQSWIWTIGYYGVIASVGACAMLSRQFANRADAAAAFGSSRKVSAPTWRDVAMWIGLAAVPSGLLLAVTAHISTDVAAVPLFWVVPLALYLLAFIIAFQTRPLIPASFVIKVFPVCVLLLIIFVVINPLEWIVSVLTVHLVAFFFAALLCHGELARRRPPAVYLTNFYMWIATGGAIGGIATGLVAPHVFSWVTEYPLLIVLAILCMPRRSDEPMCRWHYVLIGGLAISAVLLLGAKVFGFKLSSIAVLVFEGIFLSLTVYVWRVPAAFAAIAGFVLFTSYYCFNYSDNKLLIRNFFGVLYVTDSFDGRFRSLWHGTIGQGAERIRDNNGNPLTGRPQPISEFFDGGGIAQAVDAVHARVAAPINIAVVGLGTGALACRANPEDAVTYYELDPDVIRIARDPKLFTYISECGGRTDIVQGDARLRLADAADQSYDLIFVDAFLGAATPVHLLTREAMALYLRKLKAHGVLAVHVSNRNLELASVVVGAAEANGAFTRVYLGGDVEEDPSEYKWVPLVAVVARSEEDFGVLARSHYWPLRTRPEGQRIWSDDYSDILSAMMRRERDRTRRAAD
jgi:SAM-dependent methyltransferase